MFDDQSVLSTDAGEAVIEEPVDDAASLREQLAAAQARADENYNKFKTALADFDNYKKRVQRDRDAILTSYRRTVLEHFLPVLDNLERALKYEAGGERLRGGLEQTLKGFEAVLAAQGVKAIDVAGKPFDPRVAEAIGTTPAGEIADDTVVEVVEKAYGIGDDLLRPAKVIVAKSAG